MFRLASTFLIGIAVIACGESSDDGGAGTGGVSGADGGGSAGQGGASGAAGRGGSSGSGGSAGRGGSGGAGGSAGTGGGRVCGGIIGQTCETGEWCDFPDHCGEGDMQGVCAPKPAGCTEDCPGVCGCDGNSYCNACIAQQAGIDVSPTASCSDAATGGACTSDDDCTGGLKCCYPCGVEGCTNRCIVPDDNGDCPLYP